MILKPILSQALNPITRSISGVVSRFFTTFDEVAQSYILLASPLDLNGKSWEIEFSVYSENLTLDDEAVVIGKSDDDRGFIRFTFSTFNVNLTSSGAKTDFNNVPATDGEIISYSVVYDSLVGEITVTNLSTGVSQTQTVTVENANFNAIGSKLDKYTESIFSDFKVWSGGDKATGTLVLDMPIDQNYTPTNNTVIDKASGNNGTFVNVADGDSAFYQLINGQWVDANGNVLEIAQ